MPVDNQMTQNPQWSILFRCSHLICKGLRWIVDNDGLWQISAQDVEVLDVVSLDTDTMLTKQPVSTVTVGNERKEGEEEKKKKKSNQWQGQSNQLFRKTTTLTPQRKHMSTPVLHTAFGAPPLFMQAYQLLSLSCNYNRLIQNIPYLTSCFLGSKMLSSLSAYTFLEAVKRMIWEREKF